MIVELPPGDWPVGEVRAEHSSASYKGMSEKDLMILCRRLMKLTPLQASLLACLLRRSDASKDTLHNVIEGRRAPNKEQTDKKIVDVVICHLRRKLIPFNIEISTMWGHGYCLQPEHRKRANELLNAYLDTLYVPNVRATEHPVEELNG